MKETTELSPVVGDISKKGNNPFDVSLDKENDFVFVPIDTKLLRTIQAYVRKMNKYHNAETTLIRQVHEDLLSNLQSNYDYWFAMPRDDFERDAWYPDLDIFKRLPPVKLSKGPCANPRISATRLKYIRETHERWEREDRELTEELKKEYKLDFTASIEIPKSVCVDGKNMTEEQQAQIDALCSEMKARAKEIMGVKK